MVVCLLGPEPYFLVKGVPVAPPHLQVVNIYRPPVELELSFGSLTVANGAVDGATRVSQEIQRLQGLPHHAQEEFSVSDQGFHRADARRAVLPNRSHQNHPSALEEPFAQPGQFRGGSFEFIPVHWRASCTLKPPLQSPPLQGGDLIPLPFYQGEQQVPSPLVRGKVRMGV